MPVELNLDSPLATAINAAIQPKLQEVGWASESDASSLAELIVLMLANGKSEEEIATEMAGDLLHLEPGDATAREFSRWLFQQIDELNTQMNGVPAPAEGDVEMDTDSLNAPTGPRAMRNGPRGGRGGRMLGNVNRAMDRTDVLHRVRQNGNERINTHNRQAQRGRGGRMNPRNIQAGLAAAGPQWMMGPNGPQSQAEILTMLEQQNQMMFQLSQMMNTVPNGGSYARGRGGKSLFDRVQDPNRRQQRKPQNGYHDKAASENAEGGEELEMTREAPNPEDMTCKYNLRCTNKECKFAHQSPAAPPGASVDVNDPCSFGAACKNQHALPVSAPVDAPVPQRRGLHYGRLQVYARQDQVPVQPLPEPALRLFARGGPAGRLQGQGFVEDGDGLEELVKPDDDEMRHDTNQAVEVAAQGDVIG
ncbi:nuclear polyadenylated RNA-binding protein Nab2, putative [Cordyceps militaris CM01]|uniref:Nuclear polyadenylated RNA-binding protein Nab2, putative n=1 Tax=Cordyceps militaris (strain CM01) TaxID=983644 RepID=G3JLJ2_CORMM|nr:nuclear polyadenylated RNA-binding protein Nab2, putative [Cordyceps militaris CM01]EGX90566.1 nuclear polyadenylated RNA-binding protein Nab2, putative [Cordyceps militaris CM01]